ncbi:hypothetical protein ACFFRR_006638 [Megaselia abdita]
MTTSLVVDEIRNLISELSSTTSDQLAPKQHRKLYVFFGTQYVNALEILDNSTIFSFQTPSENLKKFYEIVIPLEDSTKTFKLFKDINYCSCEEFQENIALSDKPTQFTCEHVLALVLAIHLNKIVPEIISNEKFEQVIKEIY